MLLSSRKEAELNAMINGKGGQSIENLSHASLVGGIPIGEIAHFTTNNNSITSCRNNALLTLFSDISLVACDPALKASSMPAFMNNDITRGIEHKIEVLFSSPKPL